MSPKQQAGPRDHGAKRGATPTIDVSRCRSVSEGDDEPGGGGRLVKAAMELRRIKGSAHVRSLAG